VGYLGFLTRIGATITSRRRPASIIKLFQQADQYRRSGRFEEAAELVAHGLRLNPNNISGHLVAAHLHVALRRIDPAKVEFQRVLSLDPDHPRALLGLARIAMEEGDFSTCTESLERALLRYPDFPEAKALQDVVIGYAVPSSSPPQRQVPTGVAPRGDVFQAPVGSRQLILIQTDGAPVFSQPGDGRKEELAAHVAQVFRITSAVFTRCGLGAFRRGIVDGASETTFLRGGAGLILSLTFPHDVEIGFGLHQTDRLWTSSLQELGLQPSG
jgi:tetratricopeptide (TPR) repeat protein